MKKILFFAVLLCAGSANAQFTDDIESYPLGPVHTGHWNSWGGTTGAIDAIVTNIRSVSGTQSILIKEGQVQDAVLDFGNKTSGLWSVSFNMFIPTDSTGYYNFQEVTPVTSGVFALQIIFNPDGTLPGTVSVTDDGGVEVATFNYPQQVWYRLDHIIDLDNDLIRINLDGVEVYSGAFYGGGNLAGIDFFSIDANNRYYVDDVSFIAGALAIEETKLVDLNVFPNPMTDVVNISSAEVITNVAVYDMLGKQIKSMATNDTKVALNTADLTSGTYILKVNAGDKEEVLKIVK